MTNKLALLSKLLQLYTVIKLSGIVDAVDTTDPNLIVINSVDLSFCKTCSDGRRDVFLHVFFLSFVLTISVLAA